MADAPRKSPLWSRLPARLEGSPQSLAAGTVAPRRVSERELELLLGRDGWSARRALEALGPARRSDEALPAMVVACCVVHGPGRLAELCRRLVGVLASGRLRLAQMTRDDALQPRRPVLEQLFRDVHHASAELEQTRARANNDLDPDVRRPDGLRGYDLRIVVEATLAAVLMREVVARRNVRGVDFGIAAARAAPDVERATKAIEELAGLGAMPEHLLFWPPDWKRVVLVRRDGRLVYDPTPR